MLETLNSYIEDTPARSPFVEPLWARLRHNRRFRNLLALSVLGHLVFFVALVRLTLLMHFDSGPARQGGEPVRVTEIALPDSRYEARPAPEPLESADLDRMQYDPRRDDDVHLTPRSPNPAPRRAEAPKLAEGQTGAGVVPPAESDGGPPSRAPRPPASLVDPASVTPPPRQVVAQVPVQAPPTPPPPPSGPNPGAAPGAEAPPAQGQARQAQGADPATLGLQVQMSQFQAYVRVKIRKVNERIMPRSYIETVLTDRVSADFVLELRRGGRITSLSLYRSSGHSALDAIAREAIFSASPFEGYPQDASDTIKLTVTVYYMPSR